MTGFKAIRRAVVLCCLSVAALPPAIASASEPVPFAYVSSDAGVSAVNTTTNTVVATVPDSCSGTVAVAPNGAFAYVACNGSVQVISTATNTVVATVPELGAGKTGPNSIAITPNGATVYVTNLDEQSVSVISTATNAIVANVHVGNAPTTVMVTPNGEFAYVANSGMISVIATATNTVVGTIAAAMGNGAFTPNGTSALVTAVGQIEVINVASKSVVKTLHIGDTNLFGIAITPSGEFAYVTKEGVGGEFAEGEVAVINLSTNAVIATVPVGVDPVGIALTPDGTLAYVTNWKDTVASVINTATNTVVATIALTGSFGVAITPPIVGPEAPPTKPIVTPIVAPGTKSVTPITIAPTTFITPKPAQGPKPISAGAAFSLPPAKQCVSRRRFTIHVRTLPGITWTGATIKINGKRVKTVGRSRIKALVNLVGLPRGRFVLSITAVTTSGQAVTGTRTYHTCVPKSKANYAPPKL